jgi:hypothetical protein
MKFLKLQLPLQKIIYLEVYLVFNGSCNFHLASAVSQWYNYKQVCIHHMVDFASYIADMQYKQSLEFQSVYHTMAILYCIYYV